MAIPGGWTDRMLAFFPPNPFGRDFAVGDIHGHFSALSASLQAIGFDPARDRLFAMGDLIDRGPESDQVADWLAQPWFHSTRGNHEMMAGDAIGGNEYAARFHMENGGGWLLGLTQAERQRIVAALLALPLAIEVATAKGPVGLVHADLPTDDWQYLRNGALLPHEADYCLWSVERFQRRYKGKVRNVRAVVHGHMTVARMLMLGNAYFIDTGGGMEGGYFTFLDLATLKAHGGPVMGGTAGGTAVRGGYR
jgi:serine/threonine protein phosphatase 1